VEQRFWLAVRDRRLADAKFRRQATIGPYVVDFLCVQAMLVVELDGGQHDETIDAQRTSCLEGRGYRILRFWNNEVVENFEGVLQAVAAVLSSSEWNKKTLTQPSPAKAGEG